MGSGERLWFDVAGDAIEVAALTRRLLAPAAGAVATFEGRVRDHAAGKAVTSLAYEAYEELARREGERILAEAASRFALERAACVHRVGQLRVGDCAVWVGVSAAHRGAAFAACRYVIDEVKARLPVWKHERYADGSAVWVNASEVVPEQPEPVSPGPSRT